MATDRLNNQPELHLLRAGVQVEKQVQDFLLEHDLVAAGAEFIVLSLGARLAPLSATAVDRWRRLREVLLRNGQSDAAGWLAP
jgi:hypothetical protein